MLRPGQQVVDLGCWPGGWLQVAAAAVGARGRVIGLDRVPVEVPQQLSNVLFLQGELADPNISERILKALGGLAAVLLSDAAPKLSGVRDRDRANEAQLLAQIETLMPELLRPGGDLLLKVLDGPEAQEVEQRIGARFERAKAVRVKATRRGSSEHYLLARTFRP